jgi:hypothetical protein
LDRICNAHHNFEELERNLLEAVADQLVKQLKVLNQLEAVADQLKVETSMELLVSQ